MSDFLPKIPFLKLLIPVTAGILANFYLALIPYPLWIGAAGIGLMIFSFFVSKEKEFSLRWIFGLGLHIFIFGFISAVFQFHDRNSTYNFPEQEHIYMGYVLDIPQEKPRSVACNIRLKYPENKKIIVYLQKTDNSQLLSPGEEIIFSARVQAFRNFGNPDDFNYEKYMKTKGFAGSAYLPSANWKTTGKQILTVSIISQHVRAKALDFYRSFQLEPDAYAFISALTLGYKNFLTDDMQASFRASGTAHVLAVSGLHVGIVFLIFSTLFAFLGKSGKKYVLKQWLIIIALWFYAFVTGMSPSVMRAVIMLTIVCIGNMRAREGFTYNTLATAAFMILIFNPYLLFDVGFQMSFTAVLSILFFQPKLDKLLTARNKFLQYTWNLFTVSLAAQLGVFPIVLFYFGTFPTYFFIGNMLIVPLIGLIIYSIIPVIFFALLKQTGFAAFEIIFNFFRWILKSFINIVLHTAQFVENLPFAQISDMYITRLQVFLVLALIVFAALLFTRKQAKYLIVGLSAWLLLVLTNSMELIAENPPQLVVFNKSGVSEIGLFYNAKRQFIEVPANGVISHNSEIIVRLSENNFQQTNFQQIFPVDVLIISNDKSFSIKQLNNIFQPKIVVIDASISNFHKNRMASECKELGIRCHDVAQMGAFSINF